MAIIIKRRGQPVAVKEAQPAPIAKVEENTPEPLDPICKAAMHAAPNSIVPWFLMASYTYYVHDVPLISDGLYDKMAEDMLKNWSSIEHRHKHLITREALEAGSMFNLKEEDYPNLTKDAAKHLLKNKMGITI